jgi:hypothetical protein
VRSANSTDAAIDRDEVFRGPSVVVVPVLTQYRVSLSTAPVPQLQL